MLVWVILSRPTVYIWVVMKECWHYLLNYCAYFLDKDSLTWHDLNRLCVHKYVLMVRIIILIEAIKHLTSFGSGADCLDDEFIWNTYDVLLRLSPLIDSQNRIEILVRHRMLVTNCRLSPLSALPALNAAVLSLPHCLVVDVLKPRVL